MKKTTILIFFLTWFTRSFGADDLNSDLPCLAREIDSESVVCVCNSTYCDTLTRIEPTEGSFVAYVSSKAGSRFLKSVSVIQEKNETVDFDVTIEVDIEDLDQTIIGFGGAVTDSAALNWKNLSEGTQQNLINSYYGSSGLEYNMMRTPIGGSDFSTHTYTLNDYPENDSTLSNFTLAEEDIDYKIPMIKACASASNNTVNIIATCWSPPIWMKTNNAYSSFSRLKTEYYQTYADYHLKFLEAYDEAGIDIWGITTTNEPINGVIPLVSFNSLGWTPKLLARWIEDNLGPTIRNSTYKDVKIITIDDQRYSAAIYLNGMVEERPSVLDWVDGFALHWYADFFVPISLIDGVREKYPNQFLIATEACEGSLPWQTEVIIGSWSRAKSYASDIIEDLNHGFTSWLDWNLCLDPEGGPNWAENFVDAPVIVYKDSDEFIKQPMYYAMGHFSKFIPRGSQRIASTVDGWNVDSVSFLTPKDTIVTVVLNRSSKSKTVAVNIGSNSMQLSLESYSITTLEAKVTSTT